MSDAQYDLTLALLSDEELSQWTTILVDSLRRAHEAGEEFGQLGQRLHDVTIEVERRRLVEASS